MLYVEDFLLVGLVPSSKNKLKVLSLQNDYFCRYLFPAMMEVLHLSEAEVLSLFGFGWAVGASNGN